MSRARNHGTNAVGGAALLAALAGLSACEWPEKAPKGAKPLVVLTGVDLVHYRADGARSDATADRVEYERSSGEFVATTLHAYVPPAAGGGRGGVTLTAPRGDGRLGSQALHLQGGVVAVTGAGDRFETSGARYDGLADRIVTDGPIEARGEGYHATATTLEGRPGREELRLGGGVKVHSSGVSP